MTTCRQAVLDAVAVLMTRNGGGPVGLAEIVAEVGRTGGRHAESTVRTHVTAHMCVNAARPPQWPDLHRVDRGYYVLADRPERLEGVLEVPAGPIEPSEGRSWPWEGAVQTVFAGYLREQGWTVTSEADTATKARGVDVLATRGDRRLGADVKGWPSKGYADPRRSEEVKKTQPTLQAGHYFSDALVKALMLLDSHPDHDSLIVLPDYPRYRDLAARTRTGRALARVHLVLLREDGVASSETWTP